MSAAPLPARPTAGARCPELPSPAPHPAQDDVRSHGLGLLVFADWYHLDTVYQARFYDDNTRSW